MGQLTARAVPAVPDVPGWGKGGRARWSHCTASPGQVGHVPALICAVLAPGCRVPFRPEHPEHLEHNERAPVVGLTIAPPKSARPATTIKERRSRRRRCDRDERPQQRLDESPVIQKPLPARVLTVR